jgi:hypothetical protein
VAIGELSTGAGLREIPSQVRPQSPHTILHLPDQKPSRQRPWTVLAPLKVFIALATILKPSLADAMLTIPASITFGLICLESYNTGKGTTNPKDRTLPLPVTVPEYIGRKSDL